MSFTDLPKIMVAPNGARLGKADHPALPVTIPEIVEEAKACYEAGAGGIHAHVRDATEKHVLDAGLYKELLAELSLKVPGMSQQITTEAVGRYSPAEQRSLVHDVKPSMVSIALREMTSEGFTEEVEDFYRWCETEFISVQHILYAADELIELQSLIKTNRLTIGAGQVLFVLGRYSENQQSDLDDLEPFINALGKNELSLDWAVCAFGRAETQILKHVLSIGGKVRIGFENNLLHEDGIVAASNADRVAALME